MDSNIHTRRKAASRVSQEGHDFDQGFRPQQAVLSKNGGAVAASRRETRRSEQFVAQAFRARGAEDCENNGA